MGKTADICRTTCLGLSVVIAITLLVALSSAFGFLLALILSILGAVAIGMVLTRVICASETRFVPGGATVGDDQAAEAMFAPRAEPAPSGVEVQIAAEPETATVVTRATEVVPEPDAEDAEARDPLEIEPVAPQGLKAPQDGGADDLKLIKGLGPVAEDTLNEMGIYHFAQIASWTGAEVAWVEANLKGFKGRVTRDDWAAQARTLLSDGGA